LEWRTKARLHLEMVTPAWQVGAERYISDQQGAM